MTSDTDRGHSATDNSVAETRGRGQMPRRMVFGIAAIIGLLGALLLARTLSGGLGLDWVEQWLREIRDAPYAVLVVIAVFVTLSFAAAPQFGLVAACALVFGPVLGFAYSWIATMTGAMLHFYLGDRFGSRALRRYAGERTNVFSKRLGDHGILASALVRVVPSAPFVVINVAAGVSHIPFWKFALGTAVGTVPKTAVIAFVGGNLMDLVREQRPQDIALIVALIVLWIVLGYSAKRYLAPYLRRSADTGDASRTDTASADRSAARQNRS